MADIARLAGVHQTTVSRALRNDRRLPIATRERIQQVAQAAGYRPNPLVSALVALRRSRQPTHDQVALALVAQTRLGDAGVRYLAGARAAAEKLGYKLDLFIIGPNDLTPERVDHVLHARGIRGLVIAPLPVAHGGFALTWDDYSTVVVEYTFDTPAFDRVVHDSYSGMRRIMQECRAREFRRVGLTLTTVGRERTEQLNDAAYWVEQKADEFFAAIPPHFSEQWSPRAFAHWFSTHRPEVVVTSNAILADILHWLQRHGRRPGREVQVVNVNAQREGRVAGIVQNQEAIGAAAIQQLVSKLYRNDRGVPAVPYTTLAPGEWFEGATLAPRKT